MKDSLQICTKELEELFSHLLEKQTLHDAIDRVASNISSCESYNSGSLIFLQDADFVSKTIETPPTAIVTTQKLADQLITKISHECRLFTSANVGLAHALIKQHYSDYSCHDNEWSSKHPSAVIHDSVKLGENCRIGPNVVIGANVSIGENTIIRSGSVVERDSDIGSNCVIHSLVNIGFESQIGDSVVIRPGTTIANEGFGLSPDADAKFHRVPHSGIVVIEDDVQIGSNCNIDRATYGATRIKRGTKLDAQCHIAHNVELGEDCILTAHCVIAGSSKIGNRVIMSGKSGVSDHVNICDDVTLLHRASVFSDITEKGQWAGTPAKPFKDYIKELRTSKQLSKLTDRIKRLEAKIDSK